MSERPIRSKCRICSGDAHRGECAQITAGLKPCPFCGNRSGLEPFPLDDEQYAVCCPRCNAQGGYYGGNDSTSPSEAVAVWNQRATPPE
jgi:Lar family restriction alleviation protein